MERRAELLEVIRSVRNRWRQKLAVRGVVLVVAGTLLALFLSASSLEALRFSPGAIISFRLIAVAVFAALIWQFLVRPLRRRVSDTQVAMYLEENDPKLEAAILSAIEATSGSMISQDHSPRLVEKLVEQAIDQCHDAMAGHHVDRRALKRHAMALRRGHPRGAAARRVRPGVSAPWAVGTAHRDARGREGEPVLHRSDAGRREDGARRRSADQGPPRRLHLEGRGGHGAQFERRAVRAHSTRRRRRPVRLRGDALPSGKGHRVLRRGDRREVDDVQHLGPRPAHGRQARARVPLPRLHGTAGAED